MGYQTKANALPTDMERNSILNFNLQFLPSCEINFHQPDQPTLLTRVNFSDVRENVAR